MSTPEAAPIPASQLLVTRRADIDVGGGVTLFTIPGQSVWQVLAFRFSFAATGAAGSRFPVLTFDDGTLGYAFCVPSVGQNPGTTVGYNYLRGYGAETGTAALGYLVVPLPDLPMLPGHRIRIDATGVLGGDFARNIVAYVRAWSSQEAPLQRQTLLADPRIAEAAIGG